MNGKRTHNKHSEKHLDTRGLNIAHQKQNLKDGTHQVAPSLLHLTTGHTESSTQVAMLLGLVAGATLHMGGKRARD
jgi:hypothetical protein